MKPVLKLDWCSHEAAKYAVEKWHYSGVLPRFKVVHIGVWEDGRFIGVVLFSNGAAPQAHCPYGVKRTEICELTRIALSSHFVPVSRIVAVALRLLKTQSPTLRLVVSYADPEKGHHGGIYVAGGWVYVGATSLCEQFEYCSSGQRVHTKTVKSGRRGYATRLKAAGVIRTVKVWKHKYLMPLDAEMRERIAPLAKPYPKRAVSVDSDATANHAGEGGATPTTALSEQTS